MGGFKKYFKQKKRNDVFLFVFRSHHCYKTSHNAEEERQERQKEEGKKGLGIDIAWIFVLNHIT